MVVIVIVHPRRSMEMEDGGGENGGVWILRWQRFETVFLAGESRAKSQDVSPRSNSNTMTNEHKASNK